jgi:hypothetical protein
MVSQVKTVAILMIVHGSLVCLMGLFLIGVWPAMFFFTQQAQTKGGPGPEEMDQTMFTVMTVVYIVLGSLALTAGILNVIAGIRCLYFRGRTFAVVALFCNATAVFTCYCAPTAIGLMVYGLIVLFNEETTRAFALVAEGEPVESVRAHFVRRRRRDWDDDDEEEEDQAR